MDHREKKETLLPPVAAIPAKRPKNLRSKFLGLAIALSVGVTIWYADYKLPAPVGRAPQSNASLCPQANALYPQRNAELWETLGKDFDHDSFTKRAVNWLRGAVQIPTVSYDDMGPVGQDERWEVFGSFHDYLRDAFPLVHSTLALTKVNTYGLLYEWEGSDDTLKPLLLLAHQDVVPVEQATVDEWNYPPYSGYYDGQYLWGRGSSDNKNGVIGALSSIETLLENEFEPTRTVILSFGFDEEVGGLRGARELAGVLLEKFDKDSIALLVDEGAGFFEVGGSVLAAPGIAEKGYMDANITVRTPGGHSSVPPPHTSIGILARLLVELEANPIRPHLERVTPIYDTVQCVGQHVKDIPTYLRALIKASLYSDRALRKLETELSKNPTLSALIGTTQAIDLIRGGVKVNALPEEAWAVVNHRIATQSSVAAVQDRNADILKSLAEEFNLNFTAFGTVNSPEDADYAGTLTLLDRPGTSLEPAPVTPTDEDSAPWQLLSGTIKATYNAHRGLEGEDNVIVSPGIMPGNTGRPRVLWAADDETDIGSASDTRHYWDLTPHIIRYNHNNGNSLEGTFGNNIHTVNEFIEVESFVEMIKFFTMLILNTDETTTF
ncbi:carboxypeptidase S [Gloeopeniophorella convolvens]|nr:carboxypeptidase S [Gloeopeniophorella convolvens]